MKIKKAVKIIFVILLIIAGTALFLLSISKPANGRKHTIHLVDTIYLQADPPENKLLRYMKKKYGVSFIRVEPEYKFTEFSDSRPYGSSLWGYMYNGIIVTTPEGDGEYYYVRDNYGTYLDNFGCFLVHDEAENILEKSISSVVDGEVKVACIPSAVQDKELPADMTAEYYIDNASYRFRVFVCGKGENAESEYDAILEAMNIEKRPRDDINEWIRLTYVDKYIFDQIDTKNGSSFDIENNYNVKTYIEGYHIYNEEKSKTEYHWRLKFVTPYDEEN